jgi:hypothetical protein
VTNPSGGSFWAEGKGAIMALDRDKMLAAIAAGGKIPINKASVANMGAGYICSLWRAVGTPQWAQGAIPGAAAYPTDTLAGGIDLPAFTGTTGRIYKFAPVGATANTWLLYDRIGHMGGLSGTVLTAQTVSLGITSAVTDGRCRSDMKDVEWFVEIYTDIGTTASNLSVSYTDTADTSGKTITITGFTGASPLNRSGRCVQLIPTDGIQIKSVQSVTLSASSGTVGSFGITARVRKAIVGQLVANILPPGTDGISIGLPEIKANACHEMLAYCSTTSTGVVMGELVWGQVAE